MSVVPNPTRIIPLTGTEAQRAAASGSVLVNELHTTTDTLRVFMQNFNMTTVMHGSVANLAARIALNTSSARKVLIGDWCFQADTNTLYFCNTDGGTVDGQWTPVATLNNPTPQFTRIGIGVAADATRLLTIADTVLLKTSVNLADGAAAAAGTLTNAPTAGDPTKWISIDDNGTTRYLPCW